MRADVASRPLSHESWSDRLGRGSLQDSINHFFKLSRGTSKKRNSISVRTVDEDHGYIGGVSDTHTPRGGRAPLAHEPEHGKRDDNKKKKNHKINSIVKLKQNTRTDAQRHGTTPHQDKKRRHRNTRDVTQRRNATDGRTSQRQDVVQARPQHTSGHGTMCQKKKRKRQRW